MSMRAARCGHAGSTLRPRWQHVSLSSPAARRCGAPASLASQHWRQRQRRQRRSCEPAGLRAWRDDWRIDRRALSVKPFDLSALRASSAGSQGFAKRMCSLQALCCATRPRAEQPLCCGCSRAHVQAPPPLACGAAQLLRQPWPPRARIPGCSTHTCAVLWTRASLRLHVSLQYLQRDWRSECRSE